MAKEKRKPFFSGSFLYGFSRAFDIGCSLRRPLVLTDFGNDSQGWMKDYEALKGDWENVGKDIAEATARCTKANTV